MKTRGIGFHLALTLLGAALGSGPLLAPAAAQAASLYSWGTNHYGQLGNGTYARGGYPTPLAGMDDVVGISAGQNHSLAVKADGTVWAWGYNGNGMLGNGLFDSTGTNTPVQVIDPSDPIGFLTGVVAVEAGEGHFSAALKADGSVWTWGNNGNAQLGNGTSAGNFSVPAQVIDPTDSTGHLTGIVAIAAGHGHVLALKADGTVWGWGYNGHGCVGSGSLQPTNVPQPVRVVDPTDPTGFLTHVASIDAAWWSSFALKQDGTVRAWGGDDYGELGDGLTTRRAVPEPVQDPTDPSGVLTGVTAITGAYMQALALKSDGTVRAWGKNDNGECGQGTYARSVTYPTRVLDPSDSSGRLGGVASLAGAGCSSYAVKTDGTALGWGCNYAALLTTPTPIINLADPSGRFRGVTRIAAGYQFTLALAGPDNQAPVANAGADATVHAGVPVTLDGSASHDPDGDYPLAYSWQLLSAPAGSAASLSGADAVSASLTTDLPGAYVVALTVTDSRGLRSAVDSVAVGTTNTAPVADAGPDQSVILIGAQIQLDGTASWDDNGDPVTYAWRLVSQPAGSLAALSAEDSPSPTFVADVRGDYTIELRVSDPWATSAPDVVTVSFENVTPVAVAGANQSVLEGATVYLDGSASSDANHDALTFSWSFAHLPAGSAATLAAADSATPQFTADLPGEYVVVLVVNDGTVDSGPSSATVLAVSVPDAATEGLQDLIAAINALHDLDLKNVTMRNALTNKVNAVIAMVQEGRYAEAWQKLDGDILGKTDGCALDGAPDKNDWLVACAGAQDEVYPIVVDVMNLLAGLF